MLTELERKGAIMCDREVAMLARYTPSIATAVANLKSAHRGQKSKSGTNPKGSGRKPGGTRAAARKIDEPRTNVLRTKKIAKILPEVQPVVRGSSEPAELDMPRGPSVKSASRQWRLKRVFLRRSRQS